jgi:hypothetical protein
LLTSNGVPDIGLATADKILQARKSYGPFKSVNDLQAVRGVGPKRLDKNEETPNGGRPTAAASQKTKRSGCGNEATPFPTCGRESLGRAKNSLRLPTITSKKSLDCFFES